MWATARQPLRRCFRLRPVLSLLLLFFFLPFVHSLLLALFLVLLAAFVSHAGSFRPVTHDISQRGAPARILNSVPFTRSRSLRPWMKTDPAPAPAPTAPPMAAPWPPPAIAPTTAPI